MSGKRGGTGSDEAEVDDGEVVHRTLAVDSADPEVDVAGIVADLEGADATDLTALYDCVDHLVEHLFSNPPSEEAQVQVEFTYEGYRVSLDQDGHATFRKVT